MSTHELEMKCRELRQLQALIDEAQAEAETIKDAIKDAIKAELTRQSVDELTAGEYKVRWTVVKSSRLDTSALRKAAPELCEKFTRSVEEKRFCVA